MGKLGPLSAVVLGGFGGLLVAKGLDAGLAGKEFEWGVVAVDGDRLLAAVVVVVVLGAVVWAAKLWRRRFMGWW